VQIKDALDTILEENRKKATEHAKTRQLLSDAGTSSSKKHKSSSSRRSSSISNSVQLHSRGINELYWEVDKTTSQDVYLEINQQDQS
jgi:hypothetical protein